MSESAQEMPISDARDHLADVVNRAVYSGTVTHLTRRGRRLAAIVSSAQLAADQAKAREEAVTRVCRALWESVHDADEATRQRVRHAIDRALAEAEDAADAAAVDAALAELDAGAPTVAAERLWRELGLDDDATSR